MQISRRHLAGMWIAPVYRALGQGCAPPTGVAQPFTPPGGTVINRKAVGALTAAEVTRLRLAYQRMRALDTSDPADPRGFARQANVHCHHCGGAGAEVHFSWTFLPWHRMYLFFHERILARLLNDNSFRLPYWEWDRVVSRTFPAIYRTPNTIAANSLFNPNRSASALGGVAVIPPANFSPNPMLAPNFASFGGTATASGSMETGPHGSIHVWTGGPSGDMSAFATAARDPSFYAHHCNIDRLWAEWKRRNPSLHADPTALAFRNRAFTFFDENRVLRRIRISQVLDPAPLGFGYPPGSSLSTSGRPQTFELSLDEGTRSLKLGDEVGERIRNAGNLATSRTLVLEDVVLPGKSGHYNIFAGDPPATGADQADAPNYLGYVTMILEHPHQRKGTLNLAPKKDFFDRAGAAEGTTLTICEAGQTQGTKLEYGSVYLSEES